jgi:hypothetical protein
MILGKVKAVKRIFEELEFRTGTFAETSKIKCLSGCSLCCRKSSILVTVLEFLPAAEEIVRTGSSEKFLKHWIPGVRMEHVFFIIHFSGREDVQCMKTADLFAVCLVFRPGCIRIRSFN